MSILSIIGTLTSQLAETQVKDKEPETEKPRSKSLNACDHEKGESRPPDERRLKSTGDHTASPSVRRKDTMQAHPDLLIKQKHGRSGSSEGPVPSKKKHKRSRDESSDQAEVSVACFDVCCHCTLIHSPGAYPLIHSGRTSTHLVSFFRISNPMIIIYQHLILQEREGEVNEAAGGRAERHLNESTRRDWNVLQSMFGGTRRVGWFHSLRLHPLLDPGVPFHSCEGAGRHCLPPLILWPDKVPAVSHLIDEPSAPLLTLIQFCTLS